MDYFQTEGKMDDSLTEEDEKEILKYKYVITIYHHNENLSYILEYHMLQINFMKRLIVEKKLPIKIQVNVFTSIDVATIEKESEIKEKTLDCSYIAKYFNINFENFKIKIKQKKINKIRYINIMPYEYDLIKMLITTPLEALDQFAYFEKLMYDGKSLKDQIDWNNNTIGAKRFASQAMIINKHKRNYPANCLGYFHWQIDSYIKIGVPSYAKDCFEENTNFWDLIKNNNNHILEIANFLYDPPDFRKINPDGTENNNFYDIGEIIISPNNSEYYTFMIAHYDVKHKVDHFTLGQLDIEGILGYNTNKSKTACIKGISEMDSSPYKPKNRKCQLLVHTHYDKFYITNIKTVISENAFYNPLFTNWSEDIFFTKTLNDRNLMILPFFLFTYTVKKK